MTLNNCTFVGRAGSDARFRALDSGSQVASFSIAVNRQKTQRNPDPEPLWVKVDVWGKQAQVAADWVKKGGMVGVSGEADLESWTQTDGKVRTDIKLNCRDLRLLGSKSEPQASAAGGYPDDSEVPF